MPAALEIRARIRIRATPGRVWQAATDWPRHSEWMPATTARGGNGRGAEIAARTAIGPVGFTDTMVITEWDPPRRCATRHTGRLIRGGGSFEVVPAGDLTEFRWTELIDLPVPAAVRPAATVLARWTIGPLARAGLGYALRRFARLVEAGPA
ncbi:MAG TPA: SRPBCC family protein [Streptosporangiaceae bacterium]|nr:SRPBCC family protein [Streptosporangiaceae bacterium]